MKQHIRNIIFRLLGILPGIIAVNIAMGQKDVPYMEIPQCETMDFSVDKWPGDRYTWDLYRDSTVNFAKVDGDVDPVSYFDEGMYQGSTVTVHWLDTGRYFLRVMVWDEEQCTNNLMAFRVNVLPNEPTLVLEGDSVCEDEIAHLRVIFTGMAPWEAHYTYGDGSVVLNLRGETNEEQMIPAPPLPPGRHEFWVMEVTDQCQPHAYPQPNPEKGIIKIFQRPVSTKIYLNGE